jgi:hypothetical protein
MLRAAEHINEHVPGGARVGAFNAGLLGYFARPMVINLDGLANNNVLRHSLAGKPMLDWVRKAKISYLVDAMPAGGWFGHPFAGYEILTVLPFTGHAPPGYVVARVTHVPYPQLGLESGAEGAGNISLLPWRPAGRLPAAQKAVRLEGAPAPDTLRVDLAGGYREMRCQVEWEPAGPAILLLTDGVLRRRLDPGSALPADAAWQVTLDLAGVQELRIQAVPAIGPGVTWLAGLEFVPVAAAPEP